MQTEPSGPPNEPLISKSDQSQPSSSSPSDQLISMPQPVQPQSQSQSQGTTSFTTFVWKFFSVISWAFLIITSLESYLRFTTFYSIHHYIKSMDVPIAIDLGMLQSFFLVILFFAFYHFVYLGLYKGDNSIVDPFFQDKTKFHFIPLLLVSLMNLNVQASDKEVDDYKKYEGEIISNFVFTIISLGILGYIYFITEFNHDWFIVLTIKKGIFSMLIIILWYNFCYSIMLLGIINSETVDSFTDGAGIAFSIIIGIVSLLFSFIFKDLMAAVTNLLIYIGMVNNFFGIERKVSKFTIISESNAQGIIQCVIMAINLGLVGILIFKYNNNLSENILSFL